MDCPLALISSENFLVFYESFLYLLVFLYVFIKKESIKDALSRLYAITRADPRVMRVVHWFKAKFLLTIDVLFHKSYFSRNATWKVSKYGVSSGPYFPVFEQNMQSENRKIRTRKNSLFGHFSRSDSRMLVQVFQRNAKIRTFTSRVNFVDNNEIIIASRIQKFSARITMNELSINNGLSIILWFQIWTGGLKNGTHWWSMLDLQSKQEMFLFDSFVLMGL